MGKGCQFVIIHIKNQYFYEQSKIFHILVNIRLNGKMTLNCDHSYFIQSLDVFMKNLKSSESWYIWL